MPAWAVAAALGGLAVVMAAAAVWIVLRVRSTPEKREMRRRMYLYRHGRLGDAIVTEVTADLLFYTYSVRGVEYSASQDISRLHSYLPENLERAIGVASIKYNSRNPADSMLVSEGWSGLRSPSTNTPPDPVFSE